jgi:hypothetical protein
MGRPARKKNLAVVLGDGERWIFRPGRLGIVLAGESQGRTMLADFGAASGLEGSAAFERARVAAQAPLFYEAAIDLVSTWREDGTIPIKDHVPGCSCGVCSTVLALALAEGGGVCMLCGCTQDDACVGGFGEGCAWADPAHLICTAHPPKVIAAAKRFLAREVRRG